MSRLGPFSENTIVVGDCLDIMAQMPDGCVDAIVTDPPYGLEFMGKSWDKFRSGSNWATRIIGPVEFGKPLRTKGGIPRADSQAIPIKVNLSAKEALAYQSWTTAWATEAYRILKPGAYMLVMGGTRTHHRLACGIEDAGFLIYDEEIWIYAQGFPKNYDVSKGIDKRAGAEREVVGYGDQPGDTAFLQAQGQNLRPWQDRQREEHGHLVNPITEPATPEAQYWEGYGTALKPAHEPIWLCKKPNEGTYVDNVLKHGCGAMNIDGCRIGYEQRTYKGAGSSPQKIDGHGPGDTGIGMLDGSGRDMEFTVSGRWPANVIVDCYPEEFQGGVVIEGEGNIAWQAGQDTTRQEWQGHSERKGGWNPETGYAKSETYKGNGLLGPYTRFFVIPKPSKAEKTAGGRVENKHVTVKPVRLGKWLTRLIVPHQHPTVVIDPFCGSGAFLRAMQDLNFEEDYQITFLGIDKDEESVKTTLALLEADREGRQLALL